MAIGTETNNRSRSREERTVEGSVPHGRSTLQPFPKAQESLRKKRQKYCKSQSTTVLVRHNRTAHRTVCTHE